MPDREKPATPTTIAHQQSVLDQLDFADRAAFDESRRGFVGALDAMEITDESGRVVWTLEPFTFLDGPAPDTVNPSLWRMSQLHHVHGLFSVTDRIFQIRGFDLSNMTVVLGEEGYVVIDPLTTTECAAAGMELVRRELGDRPVTAVIYTHCHVDHFGGARGVITDDDLARGVPVIAPVGFTEHAISENVYAGVPMRRRAQYMYGNNLPRGPHGLVSAGLGMTVSSGSVSFVPPTQLIEHTGQELVLDGVRFEFQLALDSEAPAEMHFYLPDQRALCMAENVSHHMHNIYTPRGAQVRDAAAWSNYIHEALVGHGARSDVMFLSHHWPVWGREQIRAMLTQQRDLYRYIHDETLRLAAHGLTAIEIAEELRLPPSLDTQWASRGYYGTLNHNVKAVYQRYLGWFDGNPAHLHPLPPVESAQRYVDFMGGAEAVLRRARESFDAGDYRWVAQVVNHVVFADPQNQVARELQADALEQLGYQAESGPWRNFYLTGAQELRDGIDTTRKAGGRNEIVTSITTSMILDNLAIRLNGPRAAEHPLTVEFVIADADERWKVELSNGVLVKTRLLHEPVSAEPARPVATLPRLALGALATGRTTIEQALDAGLLEVDGDIEPVSTLFTLTDSFDGMFAIVVP